MKQSFKPVIYVLTALVIGFLAWRFGPALYRLCSNRELLKSYLDTLGVWAPVMFVFLTAAQVIVAPIPAIALGLAGGYLFGEGAGFLLSLIGLLVGSMLAFVLARVFGQPLVVRLVGNSTYRKLEKLISGKGILAVALIFLLPMMPDDALCLLAGLTPMRARVFAFLVLTCRSPGVLVASLTGGGALQLPWQIWAAVGVASMIALYVGWRYNEQLMAWAVRLAGVQTAARKG